MGTLFARKAAYHCWKPNSISKISWKAQGVRTGCTKRALGLCPDVSREYADKKEGRAELRRRGETGMVKERP